MAATPLLANEEVLDSHPDRFGLRPEVTVLNTLINKLAHVLVQPKKDLAVAVGMTTLAVRLLTRAMTGTIYLASHTEPREFFSG